MSVPNVPKGFDFDVRCFVRFVMCVKFLKVDFYFFIKYSIVLDLVNFIKNISLLYHAVETT